MAPAVTVEYELYCSISENGTPKQKAGQNKRRARWSTPCFYYFRFEGCLGHFPPPYILTGINIFGPFVYWLWT
jgi:hypothetical protein